jgi:hypothetical protein
MHSVIITQEFARCIHMYTSGLIVPSLIAREWRRPAHFAAAAARSRAISAACPPSIASDDVDALFVQVRCAPLSLLGALPLPVGRCWPRLHPLRLGLHPPQLQCQRARQRVRPAWSCLAWLHLSAGMWRSSAVAFEEQQNCVRQCKKMKAWPHGNGIDLFIFFLARAQRWTRRWRWLPMAAERLPEAAGRWG